ncbi:MAG: dienelactone hydrolase family protein [Planctomycetes bacterium]|nr:dienelactone hydrolase family protein [Planctomycetota bacterium]
MTHTVEQIERSVAVPADGVSLDGNLVLPAEASGVVLFAHGSGSSRHSPRNRFVARALNAQHLGTLLIDLLTSEEEAIDARTGDLRFDIELLAGRLVAAIDWLSNRPETRELKIGCFGASTGAGAALLAAVARPDAVAAVVSRGGRPDLAGQAMQQVRAPTLLIVGGRDYQVIELNKSALEQLGRAERKRLDIVPGATHLFEEPGTLEQVAHLAADWFREHLRPAA